MNLRASPFRPATMLAVLLVGGLAFVLLLFALGAGLDGRSDRNGGAHAAANGLNGFSALADLLERRGYAISVSRSEASLQDEALLIVTPQHFADGEQLAELISERRYAGPTLIILPKWYANLVPDEVKAERKPGWVILGDAVSPEWLEPMGETLGNLTPQLGQTSGWRGFGLNGKLPDPKNAQAARLSDAAVMQPLIRDSEGDMLAGYRVDDGYYPVLARAAGLPEPAYDEELLDEDSWPVVFVMEPDLMNNYGLSDMRRAQVAVALVEAMIEDYELPIVFDLTIAGLGRNENLLTLAFRPPFLAATLCLILAAIIIAWRGFRRFGPPLAPQPAMAMGKRQLARNGASLIERAGRLHLLGPPYAAMIAARLARALGIREQDPAERDLAIARALEARGISQADYQRSAERLRQARHPGELLRAASTLRTIERNVTQ